jgi:membrane-bound lytic murein transglycosylase B
LRGTRRAADLVALIALTLACGSGARLAVASDTVETQAPDPPAAVESAPPPAAAATDDSEELGRVAVAKGWGYLVERLVNDGLDRSEVTSAFADPRVPSFDGLFFSLEPRESRHLYREVLTRRSVLLARECREENARALETAEQAHGVSAEVITAILHVETRCGRNTGSSLVLPGLARLAMANEPSNLAANLERRANGEGVVDEELAVQVRVRAQALEEMFYPEVRATFQVAQSLGLQPLEMTGSSSGAFGAPQFLPTSYQRYGEDGNGDGRIDLFEIEDAAASTARFLEAHGWRPGLTRAQQREVIWSYNRSDAYIDAVLALAARLSAWRHHELRASVASSNH